MSEGARSRSLPPAATSFPPAVQRQFTNISSYEPAEFLRRLLPVAARSALVIGVGSGRDAHWLAAHGLRITSLDLALQNDVNKTALATQAQLGGALVAGSTCRHAGAQAGDRFCGTCGAPLPARG